MPNLKLASIAALASVAATTVASIPLEPGDYGAAGLACNNQPNATIMSFDGRNFAYPHSSRCVDIVTGNSSGVLTISETCNALGDGSSIKPDTTKFKLRPQGKDRFELIKSNGIMKFRRCGDATFFEKH